MRLWIFSDLHLERAGAPGLQDLFRGQVPDADACVVAGDVHKGARGIAILGATIAPFMPVIFVPGNHEFWGARYDETMAGMKAEADRTPNLHLLAPGTIEFGGVRFIGATLWTDYDAIGDHRRAEIMSAAEVVINDHKRIRVAEQDAWTDRSWTPADARGKHFEELSYIKSALSAPFSGKTVIVTHHGVTPKGLAQRFMGPRDEIMVPMYFSDLKPMIEQFKPAACIHGHVHDSVRLAIGTTDVIANPVGYAARNGGTENPNFDPQLVVDIGVDMGEARASVWDAFTPPFE